MRMTIRAKICRASTLPSKSFRAISAPNSRSSRGRQSLQSIRPGAIAPGLIDIIPQNFVGVANATPSRCGRDRCFRTLGLHRTGIEALGGDVAIDKFDHCDRSIVAVPEARLDDADVPAIA